MPRPAARQFSDVRGRDDLPGSALLGLLLMALLINGVGLYGTSEALSRALEPKPQGEDDEEELVEFDLVEPPSAPPFVSQDEANGLEPEDPERESDVDSDPEHETQAPNRKPTPTSEGGNPGPAKDDSEKARGRPDGGDQGSEHQGEAAGEGEGQDPGPGDDSLADAPDGQNASEGAKPGAQKGSDPLAGLGGSTSMLDKTFGQPGSNDRMRDVDEGVSNILESKRHLFASFFNRIRDQVADQWRPAQVHHLVDPNGSRYGDKQRTTVLMVRLDAKGHIVKILVEGKSGAPHLDEEAIRAMKAAAPFLNPPTGLADGNGNIDFRFGFILDFNGGSRIFRYQ